MGSLGLTLLRSSLTPDRLAPAIELTGSHTVLEGSVPGTGIGTFRVTARDRNGQIIVDSGPWVYRLADTLGGLFQIDGDQLEAGAVATDYEIAQAHKLRVRAHDAATDRRLYLEFGISVSNVSVTITGITAVWEAAFSGGVVPDTTGPGTKLFELEVEPPGDYALQIQSDPDLKFSISQDENDVWCGYLFAPISAATHSVVVRASTPEGAPFDSDPIVLTRVIVNQPPSDAAVNWSSGFTNGVVSEGTLLGTKIFDSITVTDDHISDTHDVTIDDPDGYVSLVGGEGFLLRTLHAATQAVHTFTVRVVDQDLREFTKVFAINVGSAGVDAGATALIARSTESMSAQRETNVRRLYHRLKVAGWLSACDFLFVPMSHTQQFGNENWKAELGELAPQNSCPWTQNIGYTGNGSTHSVLLGIDPVALGTLQMTQSSIFGFVLVLTDASGSGSHLGSSNSRMRLRMRNSGAFAILSQTVTACSQSNAGGTPPSSGFVMLEGTTQSLYRNANKVDEKTVTPAGLPNALELFHDGSGFMTGEIAAVLGGKPPSTFVQERISSLHRALIEFKDRISIETGSPVVADLAGTAAGTSAAVGTLNIGRLQGTSAGTSTAIGQLSLGGSTQPLPDIDLLTTTAGVSYARAGVLPYIDANGDYAEAAANVWPLDHSPTSPFAEIGRPLYEDDVLTNYGTKRVFTGWTASGVTFGANAGYTTWFGDTLGARLTEASGSTGVKRVVGPNITTPMPKSGPFYTASFVRHVACAIVKPGGTWTNRRLRMIVQMGATNYFYRDFDLANGTLGTHGQAGQGFSYNRGDSGEIVALKNGFFRIMMMGTPNQGGTNSAIQIVFQLVDASGGTNLTTGTANWVEIDGVDVCAACSRPPIFKNNASMGQATVGLTGITIPIDIGMTDDANVEYYRRENFNTEDFGVVPVGGVAKVLWPLETINRPSNFTTTTGGDRGRANTQFQAHSHVKRLRALVAGEAEPLVFPIAYAGVGKTTDTRIVPSSSPFTVTLSGTPGDPKAVSVPNLTRVASSPAAGQFSVSGAVVTFNSAEGGTSRKITWYPVLTTQLEPTVTGGGAAAWQDITNSTNDGAGSLFAAWSHGPSVTTPRRYRLGNGLPELLRASGTAQIIQGANITLRGHGQTIVARGGELQIGKTSMADGTPFNILVEDFIFAAGEFPPGRPPNYQSAYAAPVLMGITNVVGGFVVGAKITVPNGCSGIIEAIVQTRPAAPTALSVYCFGVTPISFPDFAAGQVITQSSGIAGGASTATATITSFTQPTTPYGVDEIPPKVDGWAPNDFAHGYLSGDTDAVKVLSGTRCKFRNCLLMWGLDETYSNYNLTGAISNHKDWVLEYCIIAEGLMDAFDPVGRWSHAEWQGHSCGYLVGSSHSNSLTGPTVRNMTGRFNIHTSNRYRNPLTVAVTGLHWYNNISHITGTAFGLGMYTKLNLAHMLHAYEGNVFVGGQHQKVIELQDQNGPSERDHSFALYIKDNVRRAKLLDASTEVRLTKDYIAVGIGADYNAKVFTRERPFFTDRVPMPCRTPAEVDAMIAHVISLAGVRARDVNDNPIPGPAGAAYHTQRLIDVLVNDTAKIIDTPSQIGGYKNRASTVWYVNSAVATSGSGTSWATAWKQPTDIDWTLLRPGDEIRFSGGTTSRTYTGGLIVDRSGCPGFPIKITKSTESGHNGTVIHDGQNARIPIDTNEHGFITIEQMTATNTNDCCVFINKAWLPNSIVVQDMVIIATGPGGGIARGIVAKHCKNMNPQKGTKAPLVDAPSCRIRRNTVTTASNSTDQTDCVYLEDNWNGAVVVEDNILTQSNIGTAGNDCIAGYDTGGAIIRRNRCTQANGGTANYGMRLKNNRDGGLFDVYNNVVRMLGATSAPAISHENETSWSGRGRFFNNTVYGVATKGIELINCPTSEEVKNNIIYLTAAGSFGVHVTGAAPLAANVNYNDIFTPASTVASVAGVTKTWAQWQALGYDAAGRNVDPLFTSAATGVFTLSPSSPVKNVALTTTLVTPDIAGVVRPQETAYDMGAYEGGGEGLAIDMQQSDGQVMIDEDGETMQTWEFD